MTLKICLAQLNLVVGDLAGNSQKIIAAARSAYADGVRLLLTPELSICGYAAEDLFLRPAFISACDDAVKTVARELAGLKDMTVVVGHPTGGDSRTRSVAVQTVITPPASCVREPWWLPTPSGSCPTTRCLTSVAISHRARVSVCLKPARRAARSKWVC